MSSAERSSSSLGVGGKGRLVVLELVGDMDPRVARLAAERDFARGCDCEGGLVLEVRVRTLECADEVEDMRDGAAEGGVEQLMSADDFLEGSDRALGRRDTAMEDSLRVRGDEAPSSSLQCYQHMCYASEIVHALIRPPQASRQSQSTRQEHSISVPSPPNHRVSLVLVQARLSHCAPKRS